MPTITCEQPIRIGQLFADPDAMRVLIARHAPYWPVMRYFANPAEEAAQNGGKSVAAGRDFAKAAKPMRVMPVFRGDWAYDEPLVEGADAILHHAGLIAAAQQTFAEWGNGTPVVVPQIVYINLTTPMPGQPAGHVDIPAFRGIDRTEYPTWLLQMMGQSHLFEDVRIRIATAVGWLYRGENGAFSYWPDGPDGERLVHDRLDNTAIVGDNDFMFHRVERVGRDDEDFVRGMSLESLLHPADETQPLGDWVVTDDDNELARLPFDRVRVSVSWKAKVFRDADARRIADEHVDDITIDEVVDRFRADLAERDIGCPRPADPTRDVDFIATLADAYRVIPAA